MKIKLSFVVSYLFIGFLLVYPVMAFSQVLNHEIESSKLILQSKLKSISNAKEGNYYSALLALGAVGEIDSLDKQWKSFYHYLVFKINPESAYKDLKRLSLTNPDIENELTLGNLYLLDNKIEKAFTSFQIVLVKDPLNPLALKNLEYISKLKSTNHETSEEKKEKILILESSFFPIITDEQRELILNKSEEQKILSKNVSKIEINLGPLAKKYELEGIGFNALVNYTTGLNLGIRYEFSPKESVWNTYVGLAYSKTTFDNLVGLIPNKVSLNETRMALGFNYFIHNYSLGPILMYESTYTTRTVPSTFKGNSDFFNLGAKFGYEHLVAKNLFVKLEATYLSKIISVSKPIGDGEVGDHNSINFLGKLILKNDSEKIFYFLGLGYSMVETKYTSTATRGTLQAKEKEKIFSFPIGINYEF